MGRDADAWYADADGRNARDDAARDDAARDDASGDDASGDDAPRGRSRPANGAGAGTGNAASDGIRPARYSVLWTGSFNASDASVRFRAVRRTADDGRTTTRTAAHDGWLPHTTDATDAVSWAVDGGHAYGTATAGRTHGLPSAETASRTSDTCSSAVTGL